MIDRQRIERLILLLRYGHPRDDLDRARDAMDEAATELEGLIGDAARQTPEVVLAISAADRLREGANRLAGKLSLDEQHPIWLDLEIYDKRRHELDAAIAASGVK